MAPGAPNYDSYKRVGIETSSQGKLVIMLFNGAIQRAEEAKRSILAKNIENAHKHLVRAQDIIGELRASLDMSAGSVAHNLDRIYEYLHHLLIQANLTKTVQPIDQCLELLQDIRDTWQEAFNVAQASGELDDPPRPNPQGSVAVDMQG